MKKVQNWIVTILFLAVIFGTTALTILHKPQDFSERENRALAQLPIPTVDSVFSGDFASDYETYLSDQFVGRDQWISLKTRVERMAGKQEIKDVYYARDNYLIESHNGTFETDQAKTNIRLLAQFAEIYRSQFPEEHMTVMVVPNAVEVLDYLLPLYAPDSGERAYLDAIEAALPEGVWFESEPVLKDHVEDQLYYRTDHHWTTLAAFYVYEAWADSLGLSTAGLSTYTRETLTTDFLGTIESKVGGTVTPDSIQRFVPANPAAYTVNYNNGHDTGTDLYHMDMLETKDKYAVFFGGNQGLVQVNVDNGQARKLLVVKDSYANCFVPFAFENFGQVDMVDVRYYNGSLSELIGTGEYTDLLFLYNASGFAEDVSLQRLLN